MPAELPALRLTYAVTPPNQTTSSERRRAMADAQSARVLSLPIDALLVYDLQDEAVRNAAPRPFPFVPKVDALTYAFEDLRLGALPRIVYRAVSAQGAASLSAWLDRLRAHHGMAVFVGAPSRSASASLTLPQAATICRSHTPELCFGGVVIPERHEASGSEDARVWAKMRAGCRFFVSQTVWSASATKRLLRDLCALAERERTQLPPILLTLSPCGSEQTLAFQEWLGVSIPRETKRDLLGARDMLARSVELATEVFEELRAFAAESGLVVGCNVESVSSRSSEIEASVELVRRIDSLGLRPPAFPAEHALGRKEQGALS